MSSRNLQKEKKAVDQQDPKKESTVKLRRKESNAKGSQAESQRKSVFRFLHRDKKKGPELPEHGFIPDARRVLESSSKSLTLSQGVTSYSNNRWSSYEPLDFSKLSSCDKTDNSLKEPQQNINPTSDESPNNNNNNNNNGCFRSFSHESVTSETLAPTGSECPKDILSEEEINLPSKIHNHQPCIDSNLIIGEKIRKIDERLNDAFMAKRRILEQIFNAQFEPFPISHCHSMVDDKFLYQVLMLNSFISSEKLTKLACHSLSLNRLTSENVKEIKEIALGLKKNLTQILDELHSNPKVESDLQSQPSSLSSSPILMKPSMLLLDSEVNESTACSEPENFIFNCPKVQPFSMSEGMQSSWPNFSTENSIANGSTEAEPEEVLSKIDEENEDLSTTDRSSPFRPVMAYSPVHEFPMPLLRSELNAAKTSSQKIDFEKDSCAPVISKSFSNSCFSELKIQSSIAEEDEESNSDRDLCLKLDENKSSQLQFDEASHPVETLSYSATGINETDDESCSESFSLLPNHPNGLFMGNLSYTSEGLQSCGQDFGSDNLMKNEGNHGEDCIHQNDKTSNEIVVKEKHENSLINEKSVNELVDNEESCKISVASTSGNDIFEATINHQNLICCLISEHDQITEVRSKPLEAEQAISSGMVGDGVLQTGLNIEHAVCLIEPLDETVEFVPLETSVAIAESPSMETMNVLDVNSFDDELKVESPEILTYCEEKMDSIEDEDESDVGTPVNSDSCDPLEASNSNGEVNQTLNDTSESSVVLKVDRVPLPAKNKKRSRRKKKK